MRNFLHKKNDEIKNRAEKLFNQISDKLFSNLYIVNPKAISVKQFPFDITLENALSMSDTWSLENGKWIDTIALLEIHDIKKQKSGSKYFQSSVILSNDNNGTFYLIYLFLNPQKYNRVDNQDFLEQIVNSFFTFYLKEIQYGNNLADEESARQLIYTEAASNYLSDKIFSIYGKHNTFFYRNLISLSTQKYESIATKGKIIIGKNIGKTNLLFEEKINISENLRMARKVIQLTNEKTFIICDANSFIGLHYKNGNINYDNDYFIEFTGYNSFRLIHGKKERLLDVRFGIPCFPNAEEAKYEVLTSVIKEQYPDIAEPKIEKLKRTISSIVKYQKHGAVIVIEENAGQEAERLKNISIKIKEPFTVNTTNRNKYKTFGEIDGAILLDFEGYCHSFGVILDGEHLNNEGNKERGSRYNSSLRYLRQNQKKSKTLIIVISEDGGFDILK